MENNEKLLKFWEQTEAITMDKNELLLLNQGINAIHVGRLEHFLEITSKKIGSSSPDAWAATLIVNDAKAFDMSDILLGSHVSK